MLHLVIIFGEAGNDQLDNYPYHYLCHLPNQAAKGIGNIDRARKQCLWHDSDVEKKGGNLFAWPVVMKPKDKGGLGVLNLQLQNDVLLLKQLSKFYNRADIPWVHLVCTNTMPPRYHMQLGKWVPFGGKMFFSSTSFSKALLNVS